MWPVLEASPTFAKGGMVQDDWSDRELRLCWMPVAVHDLNIHGLTAKPDRGI